MGAARPTRLGGGRLWAGVVAVVALAIVVASGLGDGDRADPGGGAGAPERVAADDGPPGETKAPEIATTRVVSKDGHPSHPTWYHVSQIVERDGLITVAYNGDSKVFAAQLRADDLEIVRKRRLDVRTLGGREDTTGTDTNRHDVPAVVADGGGRLHFVYGGGSLAARQQDGPLVRSTKRANDIRALRDERALDIGGGAAFDFEAATTPDGVTHLVGQRGRGHTGSLIELRLRPDGSFAPPRQIIRGDRRADACVRGGRARGCNRFAISRLRIGPDGDLHLVWGYSEESLSEDCGVDRGYCDVNLYYARSRDGGATWSDDRGRATTRIFRRAIAHDDRRYRIAAGPIGLFKAVAISPAGVPLVVYTRGPARARSLYARRMVGGRWRSVTIADSATTQTNYQGAPVLRADDRGYTLWMATGQRILRFTSRDGERWERRKVYDGPAWSLTGIPAARAGQQLLMWRGERGDGASLVMLGRAPAGR